MASWVVVTMACNGFKRNQKKKKNRINYDRILYNVLTSFGPQIYVERPRNFLCIIYLKITSDWHLRPDSNVNIYLLVGQLLY